jgi:hypothetical protein
MRLTIPCYTADGTCLGHRTLAAAQRLVAGGYVRPAYGRKGHLRAIWQRLLRYRFSVRFEGNYE